MTLITRHWRIRCACVNDRFNEQDCAYSILSPSPCNISCIKRNKAQQANDASMGILSTWSTCMKHMYEAHEAHIDSQPDLSMTYLDSLLWFSCGKCFNFMLKKTGYHPTDRQTDRRTDTPSYRDARTHLKIEDWKISSEYALINGQTFFFRLNGALINRFIIMRRCWFSSIHRLVNLPVR